MADVSVSVGIVPDKASIKKTEKAVAKSMDKAFAKVGKAATSVGKKIAGGFKSNKAVSEIDQTTQAMDKLNTSTEQAVLSTKDLEDQFGRVSSRAAALGDVESGTRTIGGAVGSIGAIGGVGGTGEIEAAVAAFSEIPAALEAVPKLAQRMGSLGVRIASAIPVVGALVPGLGGAIAAMTGLSVSTATMVVAALPLVALGAAIAAAFFFLAKSQKDAQKAAEEYAEVVSSQAETFADVAAALESGDVEEATQTLIDIEDELSKRRREEAFILTEIANTSGKKQKELKEAFNETNQEVTKLEGQLQTGKDTFRAFGQEFNNANTEEVAAQEKELTDKRDQSIQAIKQLEQEESNLISDRQDNLARAAEDQAIKGRRAAEDLADAAQKSTDKLAQITTDGNKKIQQVTIDGNKELVKITADGEEARIDEIASFEEEQAKIREEFAKSDIESQIKFNEEKAQAQQEFNNSQFEAILNNDIIGAQKAQRRFEREESDRESEFAKAKQVERAQAEERLRILQKESQLRLDAITAGIQEEIIASKVATAAKISDAKKAASESLAAENKAQSEAEKQRQKQSRRAAEDQALKDKREEESFQERLAEIDKKKSAESNALQAVLGTLSNTAQAAIGIAGQAAAVMVQAVGNVAQATINSLVLSANAAAQGNVPSFADGGRIGAGTIARVNDAPRSNPTEFFRPDVSGRIIPMAGNIAGGGGGRQTTVLDFRNMTVGDIATREMVMQTIRGAASQLAQNDVQVLADSLAGV